MTLKEVVDATMLIPPILKDLAAVAIIFSLIEIAPIKLNPWKWIKAFIALPTRLNQLETEFNHDRAFRWRSMILTRADHIRRGDKLSKERWDDTIETIDHYEAYCERQELIKDDGIKFLNGKAKVAIAYLREHYRLAYDNNDFLQ